MLAIVVHDCPVWVAAALDVVVGVVVGLAGVVVLLRLRRDAVGLLLVSTSAVWFAGSLAAAETSVVHTVGLAVQFLHRGVLFHAVLISAVPLALIRRQGRHYLLVAVVVLIGAGYVVSAWRPLAVAVLPTLLVGTVVAGVVMLRARREPDRYRQVAWWSTAAGLLLWVGAATLAQWAPESERIVAGVPVRRGNCHVRGRGVPGSAAQSRTAGPHLGIRRRHGVIGGRGTRPGPGRP